MEDSSNEVARPGNKLERNENKGYSIRVGLAGKANRRGAWSMIESSTLRN